MAKLDLDPSLRRKQERRKKQRSSLRKAIEKQIEQEVSARASPPTAKTEITFAKRAEREGIMPAESFERLAAAFKEVVRDYRANFVLLRGSTADFPSERRRRLNANTLPKDTRFSDTDELLLLCLRRWKLDTAQKKLATAHQLSQPKVSEWLKQSIPWMNAALHRLAHSEDLASQELAQSVVVLKPWLKFQHWH